MTNLSMCLLCAAPTVALALSGCQSGSPSHSTESEIADAVGLSDAVVFSVEGGPVDDPASVGSSLPLADALRRALRNDPGLHAALARVRIALADSEQARLWPNPILSIVFRFPENSGKPFVEAGLAADVASILRTPGRVRAADHRLRQTASEALVIALDLVQAVEETYSASQALDRQQPLLEERRGITTKLIKLGRDRLDAGEGTRADLTVLSAQNVSLEVEIAEVSRQRNDLRLHLAKLIGQPSSAADWSLDTWTPSPPMPDQERWIASALDHRPEIQSRLWELAALGDDLTLARWALFEGSSVELNVQRNDAWEGGPGISGPIPLFDWGQAKRARITAQQIEVRHLLTQTKRQVVEDVRRAFASLAAARANMRRVESELIPIQQRRRSEAESVFSAGESDSTAVFLAEQDLRAAQARLIDLQRDAAAAAIRLERAVGGPAVISGPRTPETPDRTAPNTSAAPQYKK
jgi:outer membrane protein TolC